jgi:hypothetical protein
MNVASIQWQPPKDEAGWCYVRPGLTFAVIANPLLDPNDHLSDDFVLRDHLPEDIDLGSDGEGQLVLVFDHVRPDTWGQLAAWLYQVFPENKAVLFPQQESDVRAKTTPDGFP